MNLDLVNQIANAVLYEGYMLYPYRPSAVKNRQRWNFGVLYPPSYAQNNRGNESASMQTECLVRGNAQTTVEVRIRFLQLIKREIAKVNATGKLESVDSLEVEDQLFQSWDEAAERELIVPPTRLNELGREPSRVRFEFAGDESVEDIGSTDRAVIVRKSETLNGVVEMSTQTLTEELTKLTIRILNETEINADGDRDQALLRATISTHTILGVSDGEFVSQLDPPAAFHSFSEQCVNNGTWPVLVGDEGINDTMLSSPIILYDYPQIAPESAGNLFDGTEIDEILTLRIMTLTDEEKREMRSADERSRQILERTESLPAEQFMKMHGAVRGLRRAAGRQT